MVGNVSPRCSQWGTKTSVAALPHTAIFYEGWSWYTFKALWNEYKNGLNSKSNLTARRLIEFWINIRDSAEFGQYWNDEMPPKTLANQRVRKKWVTLVRLKLIKNSIRNFSNLFLITCIQRLKYIFEYLFVWLAAYNNIVWTKIVKYRKWWGV